MPKSNFDDAEHWSFPEWLAGGISVTPGARPVVAMEREMTSKKTQPAAKAAPKAAPPKVKAAPITKAKPAKATAAKAEGEAKAPRVTAKAAALREAAERGELPTPPDFSAATHTRFRKKLAEIVALVEGRKLAELKALVINPVSTSPKAMARYRDLAVIALEHAPAKTKAKAA